VRAPIAFYLITHKTLFPVLIVDGDIKQSSSELVSVDELSFQLLDVMCKSGSN
jgi:hypothetical protein